MEFGQDKEPLPKPLSQDEKYLRAYGKLPRGGGLLGRRSKERKYFDSGDYALTAADRVTDIGTIHTGTAHPLRGSISHPYAPVPNTSNTSMNANSDFHDRIPILECTESHLHQPTNSIEDEKPGDLESVD